MMDRAYISELERNLMSPTVERLFRICRAIGIPAATVIARVERSSTGADRPHRWGLRQVRQRREELRSKTGRSGTGGR